MQFEDLNTEQKWERICEKGLFLGKRIELIDPDDDRFRNVYEDLDQESLQDDFKVILTMFPEYSKAASKGIDDEGVVLMTHEQAIKDIKIMLKHGYKIRVIERDRVQV